jgi:hypothetical protein
MDGLALCEQLRVPFGGDRTGTGPVTFGQHDTLLWVWNGANELAALLFWRLTIPSGARLADIGTALGVLLTRHESLRTRFVAEPEPAQVVTGPGELLVDVLRVEPALAGAPLPDVENLLVDVMRAEGVDIAAGPPLRVTVAVLDGVPTAAVMLCSHVAADLGSLAVIGQQFTELVTALTEGRPLPVPATPDHQPLDQAEFERTRVARRRSDTAIRHWAERLRTAPQAMFPVPAPAEPADGHLSGFLHSRAGGLALTRIAERTSTGRQAVLLAAVCTVLSVRTGVDRCTFSVLSGNRFRGWLHGYVGALVQDGLLAFDIGGASFDEVVRRVVAATLTANTHALYDIVGLRAAKERITHERGITLNRDFSFNNLSELMSAEADPTASEPTDTTASVAASTVEWLNWGYFPEMLMCHPVSLGPELVFAMTGNLRQVSKDELESLLHGVDRLLVAAAAGPVPLTGLAALTGVEAVPRGPDWVLVDACWVRLSNVRSLVTEALDTPAAFVTATPTGLRAYLPAGDRAVTPEQAHAACMAGLGDRYNTMAPGHYVLCDGVPADVDDEEAWRALPVVATGSGRRNE